MVVWLLPSVKQPITPFGIVCRPALVPTVCSLVLKLLSMLNYIFAFFNRIWYLYVFLQRNKYIRKPLGSTGRPGGAGAVIPDSEYRNLSSLIETEAERNRILARNGFNTNMPTENRSDSITPNSNSKRVLSASGQRKDNGKIRVTHTHIHDCFKVCFFSHLEEYSIGNNPPHFCIIIAGVLV